MDPLLCLCIQHYMCSASLFRACRARVENVLGPNADNRKVGKQPCFTQRINGDVDALKSSAYSPSIQPCIFSSLHCQDNRRKRASISGATSDINTITFGSYKSSAWKTNGLVNYRLPASRLAVPRRHSGNNMRATFK